MRQRPENFILDYSSPLAQGLAFAGLGNAAGTYTYYNSSYDFDGVLTNITPQAGWRWVNDLGRYGFLFPGAGSTAMIAVPSYMVPSDGDFTFTAWSKIQPGAAASNCIFSSHTSTGTNWLLFYTNTTYGTAENELRIYMKAEIGVGSDIRDGLWHHLALVRRGSSFKVYLDTKLDIDATYSGSVGNQYSQFGNGNRTSNNDRSHGGYMVDAMFYTRALTSYELDILSNPYDPFLSGLIQPPKRKYYAIRYTPMTKRRFRIGRIVTRW